MLMGKREKRPLFNGRNRRARPKIEHREQIANSGVPFHVYRNEALMTTKPFGDRFASIMGFTRFQPAMFPAKSILAIVLCFLLTVPVFGQTSELSVGNHGSVLNWFTKNYTPHPLPEVSYTDSPRIDKLMRAGIIYL